MWLVTGVELTWHSYTPLSWACSTARHTSCLTYVYTIYDLHWQDLQEEVLGHHLVDGPEPHVGGVGVPARRQQVGVLVPDPGDGPVGHARHAAVEDGRLAEDCRDVPRVLGVKDRLRLTVVAGIGQPGHGVSVVNLLQFGRVSAEQ